MVPRSSWTAPRLPLGSIVSPEISRSSGASSITASGFSRRYGGGASVPLAGWAVGGEVGSAQAASPARASDRARAGNGERISGR